jgi:O-antigen/teichoic acid export membrane protein
MTSLRRRTFSGLGWNGAAQISAQAIQFATSVALARLLGPQEFGLIGMVLVFTGFASIFSDMGLRAALIQRRDLTDRHVDTVFWINVGVGAVLTAVFVAAAPLIAGFYGESSLRALTPIVALTFVPAALSSAQSALIDKALDFRSRFWIETTSAVVSGIVAVSMAVEGAGVWSLAGQALTSSTTRMVMVWRASGWRPRGWFDRSAFLELFRFSRNLLGNGIVSYWGRNIDRLMLGRFVGSVGLGVYSFAFRSVTLPLEITTDVTNAVMFPAFSLIQEDRATLRRVYMRSTGMIALMTFPTMIGLTVLAEPAVLLVYGEQWRASISIMQVLALSGMAQSVYNTAAWLFLSRGRTDILLRLGLWASLVRTGGVAVGLSWGVVGVAWAYVFGSLVLLLYPTWRTAGRMIDVRFIELLRNLAGPFVCAAAMGAALWICDRWALERFAPWVRVVIEAPLGVLVYALFVHRLRLGAWRDLRTALLEVGAERLPILARILGAGASPSR